MLITVIALVMICLICSNFSESDKAVLTKESSSTGWENDENGKWEFCKDLNYKVSVASDLRD